MKIRLKFEVDENIVLMKSIQNEAWKLLKQEKCNMKVCQYEKYIRENIPLIINYIDIKQDDVKCFSMLKDRLNKIGYIYEKYSNIMKKQEIKEVFKNKIINGNVVYELLETIKANSCFKEMIRYTKLHREKLKDNWESHLIMIEKYLEELIKSEYQIVKGKVFIIPSIYESGEADLTTKEAKIIYSPLMNEKVSEIDNIYIVHELLHNPILKYKDISNKDEVNKLHSLIQFVAEKELFYRMTNIPYFENNNTHMELEDVMRNMYPFWLGYLYKDSMEMEKNIKRALLRDQMNMFDAKKICNFMQKNKIESLYELAELDISTYNEFCIK